jgi:hypothetical protein
MKKLLLVFMFTLVSLFADGSFTRDNTIGVVYDSANNLTWQDDTINTKMTWDSASNYCENLSLGGQTGWRFSSIDELQMIVDNTKISPAINPVFQNVATDFYWSSTTIPTVSTSAWIVYFYDGSVGWNGKTASYYVRCVRSGQLVTSSSSSSSSSSTLSSTSSENSSSSSIISSSSSSSLSSSSSTSSSQEFIPGNDVPVKTSTITQNGGTITVSVSGVPIDGVQISFPVGALTSSTQIQVGYNTGIFNFSSGVLPLGVAPTDRAVTAQNAKTLTIHSNTTSNFSKFVEITIPYTDNNNIPIPFYVDDNNLLQPVWVTKIDQANKTLTFGTLHASLWTWVSEFSNLPVQESGFNPSEDGFKITNYGSTIYSGGECFGMSAFAQWYYYKKSLLSGNFYNQYLTSVGQDSEGRTLTGQDVIATRAHSAINQEYRITHDIAASGNTPEIYRYNQIVQTLKVTKRPIVLYLLSNSGGAHAVLAYGINDDTGEIFIYDPNFPGEEQKIHFNKSTNRFEQYGVYGNVFLNGTGSFDLSESFDNIFEDAERGFVASNQPQILINSHTNGQTVNNSTIQLRGVVESGEVLITELDIFVEDQTFPALVDSNGNFMATITLNTGENSLRFLTKGMLGGILKEITPNNTDTTPFLISRSTQNSSTISLGAGWNLITVPIQAQEVFNIQNLLDGKATIAWKFNVSSDGVYSWEKWIPGNTQMTIQSGEGLFVGVSSGTHTLEFESLSSTTYPKFEDTNFLTSKWYLIGYPYNMTVGEIKTLYPSSVVWIMENGVYKKLEDSATILPVGQGFWFKTYSEKVVTPGSREITLLDVPNSAGFIKIPRKQK